MASILVIAGVSASLALSPSYSTTTPVPTEQTVIIEEVATPTESYIVEEPAYSEEDLYWLSRLIYAEVGSNSCSDKLQLMTGSVVLNRVDSKRYPDTVKGVIFDQNPTLQYGCTRGAIYKEPNDRAIGNAKYLLENGSILPENVLGQASGMPRGWTHYATVQGVVFSSYEC